jgi:hypothetical protein
LKEADRGKDAGPRAGVEATQSGNILRKKGFDREGHSEEGLARRLDAARERQGGITFGGMGHTPKMVADFRVSLVTVIALNTAMRLKSKLSNGNALYPEFGYVFPEAELSTRRATVIKCTTSSWSTPPSASTLSSI